MLNNSYIINLFKSALVWMKILSFKFLAFESRREEVLDDVSGHWNGLFIHSRLWIISVPPSDRSLTLALSKPPSPPPFLFYKRAFHQSSNIPILGLPRPLFPIILPSNTSLNPFPLKTCPIQFFFLSCTVLIKHLVSPTLLSTSSLIILSLQIMITKLNQFRKFKNWLKFSIYLVIMF